MRVPEAVSHRAGLTIGTANLYSPGAQPHSTQETLKMKTAEIPIFRLSRYVSLLLLIGLAGLIGASSQAQTCNFSVSPSGSDSSANALKPTANMFSSTQFATPQAAEEYLRNNATALGVGQHPYTVCVYSGTYWADDVNTMYNGQTLLAGSKNVNNYVPYPVPQGVTQGGTGDIVLDIKSLVGTQANPITFTAVSGNTPVVMQTGWSGIQVESSASWIVINGFTVYGITNDFNNVNYTAATSRYANTNNPGPWPYYDGSCISVNGAAVPASTNGISSQIVNGNTVYYPSVAQLTGVPSHITIQNNNVYGCGGGGIGSGQADYISILNNHVSGCSHYSIYGTSGISLGTSENADNNTNTSEGFFKNFIVGNYSWNNSELVPWDAASGGPAITDGEGIIVDTNQNTGTFQAGLPYPSTTRISESLPGYVGRTLIADNVVTGNGGPAIELINDLYVDVIDNSTYGNIQTNYPASTDGVYKGEFFVIYTAFVNAADNIFWATQPQKMTNGNSLPMPYGGGHTPTNVPYSQYSIFLENNALFANQQSVTAPATADSYGVTEAHDYYYNQPFYVSPSSSTWNTPANLQLYVGDPLLASGSGDGFDTSDIKVDINGITFKQSSGAYAIGAIATGLKGN
jgi:hypothetical protein